MEQGTFISSWSRESGPVEEIKVANPEVEGLREDEYEVISQKVTHRLAPRPGVYFIIFQSLIVTCKIINAVRLPLTGLQRCKVVLVRRRQGFGEIIKFCLRRRTVHGGKAPAAPSVEEIDRICTQRSNILTVDNDRRRKSRLHKEE